MPGVRCGPPIRTVLLNVLSVSSLPPYHQSFEAIMAEKHGKVKKMLIHNVELKGEEKELVEQL
jgi:hypothetical protein